MSKNYREEIALYGHLPNRKFGQNFLVDEYVLDKIISFSLPIQNLNVLEVGPGLGFLSEKILLQKPQNLFSVEIDKNLSVFLQHKFSKESNFHLVQKDAMQLDEKEFFTDKCKVISNLPYNISVPLIMKWLQEGNFLNELYLLVQKEVAERIVAIQGKKCGTVSILTNYLAIPEILFEVKAHSFFPAPKVDSCFIRIKVKGDFKERQKLLPQLKTLCTAVFNNRRKMLRKTLPKIFSAWQEALSEVGVPETARPEEICWEDYVSIASILNRQQ